jgi:hypothetical protein
MPAGAFRRVIFIGRFAVKIPLLRAPLLGMRCNRWEREMWRTWRPVFGWKELCPILFADPLGVLVLMPRAAQPVSREEIDAANPDHALAEINCECKPNDWGRVDGRVLVLDYGLPSADMVEEQRAFYRRMAPTSQ